MKKAIFPGSFNPIHLGHINIIEKASKLFDEIHVVITYNLEKGIDSNLKSRKELVVSSLAHFPNVIVDINENELTANYAKARNIQYLIRSARNKTDFQYELELAAGNNYLNNELETILIIPNYSDINYQSRLIKQVGK